MIFTSNRKDLDDFVSILIAGGMSVAHLLVLVLGASVAFLHIGVGHVFGGGRIS
jgi:hypothetical protein